MLNTVFKCVHCPDHTKMSIGLLLLSKVLQQCSLSFIDPFFAKFSQDKLKNSQLHRNKDFRDHFLRFMDIRDQVFKKGTLGDLRDQVAGLRMRIQCSQIPIRITYFFSLKNARSSRIKFVYSIRKVAALVSANV